MIWFMLFVLAVGFLLAWMWSRVELADLQAEHAAEVEALESAHAVELSRVVRGKTDLRVRLAAAEASAQWHARLTDRVCQELELERVVSESYAAAIERQER